METDTLLINVHPSSSSFDFGVLPSSSSARLGGDAGEHPELAAIKQMMAAANERRNRYMAGTTQHQQAQPQQRQFSAPLPAYGLPASFGQSHHVSDVDDFVAELKQKSPEYFADQPGPDDPIFKYLKEGEGSEQGGGSGRDLLIQTTSPEIPAELERLSDDADDYAQHESEHSHTGAVARQQVKHVLKRPDASFGRGDRRFDSVESAFESEDTQKARQHDSEQQRTLRTRKRNKNDQQPSPPDRPPSKQIKTEAPDDGDLMTAADALGDTVSSPVGSVHGGDDEDDENSREADYQPSKRRKRSTDMASVADSTVADEEAAGPRWRGKKPVYQPGDLDGNKHLMFEKNKFADEDYSDTESKLKPLPSGWKSGEYPSGGKFPTLHLAHNIKDCNYGIHQQHDLIGHTAEESKAIHARIRASVESQLTALQGRQYHVSDPRHLSKRDQRDFASIIRNPSTWKIDDKLPPGVYQPPLNSRTEQSAEGAKAKQYGGYKFSFEPTEARHVKGYAKAEKLQPATICPADYLKSLAGMPSFYRLKYSSANRAGIYKTNDCTVEVIADYFNHSPKDLRDMTLAINGDIKVHPKNGETPAEAKAKAIRALGYMLKKNAEKRLKINLSDNLLYLVWRKDSPLPKVHKELWSWLEQMKKQGQVFARYTDLKVDMTSEDQVAMVFDTTGRNSLLSFALGRCCEHSLPHSTITMNAGVIHKVGQNPALLPSHHHATSGAFVEYLLEKPDEVIKVIKKDFYTKEFEKCARWDQHRKYLYNPDLFQPYGIKYVMNIRKAGETTNVIQGGLIMSLSFGVAESNSVDWLSAPPSWLVTHKPLVSAINCREKAARWYIEQRLELFEGAFETLTGIQDPGARVMRDPINSCFNCIKEPMPYVDGYTWLKNHLSAYKTGDTPRSNCCPNPFGYVSISKRVELRESNAKQR